MSIQGRSRISQKSDYRGAPIYRHEDGYAMVTMTVSVEKQEKSQVISHAYDLSILTQKDGKWYFQLPDDDGPDSLWIV